MPGAPDPLLDARMAVPRLCAPDADCDLLALQGFPGCRCPGCEVRRRLAWTRGADVWPGERGEIPA